MKQLTGDDAPCSNLCYCERGSLKAEIERLRAAIRWALGEAADENGICFGEANDDLEEGTKRRYWWRKHLRRLAALEQSAPKPRDESDWDHRTVGKPDFFAPRR